MKRKIARYPWLEWVALALLVGLAAWLRFQRIGYAEFLWDQAEISKVGLRMAREGRIAWAGTLSSTGLDTFLGAAWLMAIPHAFSTSPVFATGFVAFINLLAVIGCYVLVRRCFGPAPALLSTLLFAVAPWAVVYSRKVWHSNFLPPFVALYALTAWWAFVRRRRWGLLVHILALTALVQLHFSTLPLVLVTGLWLVLFRRRVDWRVVLVGGVIAGLTFLPFVLFDAQHDWRNVHRLQEILDLPSRITADAFHYTWLISTGRGFHWLVGPDRYPDFVAATPNARWLFIVEGALVVLGVILALGRAARQARAGLDDETTVALMAATWLLMPALFLTRHTIPPAPHYFTTTLPSQFILLGWLFWLLGDLPRSVAWAGRVLFVGFVAVLAVAQIYEVTSLLQFVITHHTPRGYGTPLAYEVEAVDTALRLGEEIGSQEVILLSEGDEPGMYEMPAVADVLMYDVPHRAIDIRHALVFPAQPAVYWVTYDRTPGEEWLAGLTPEQVQARIPLREGVRSFRFYRWSGGEPALSCLRPLPGGPRTWASGAQLVGTCLEGDLQPGGAVRWTLVWRIVHLPPETDDVYYHWFNHLLDPEGQVRAQQDGASLHPDYWRVGDTALNWFDLSIPTDAPPGDYHVRVGMYVYPAIENIPLLAAGGGPAEEWLMIGPLPIGEGN